MENNLMKLRELRSKLRDCAGKVDMDTFNRAHDMVNDASLTLMKNTMEGQQTELKDMMTKIENVIRGKKS